MRSPSRARLYGVIGSLLPEAGGAPKALAFAALGFMLQFGLVIGITTADSLFLSHVGAPGLPVIYVLQTFVMLLFTAAFVGMIKRFGIDRFFDGALAVIMMCGVIVWLAFADTRQSQSMPVYYGLKLYTGMWYFGLYTLFWTFLDSYYDLTDAKRLYALFAAGSAAGAMVGAALVSLLAASLDPGIFFLIWAGLALATWPVLAGVRRRWPKIDTGPEDAAGDVLQDALAGVKSLGESRYAFALTAGFFMIAVTATICDYQYMRVFSAGRSEAELAVLFGRLTFVANLANMLITLFLFNPLVARFGVRNLALLQPLVFGAVFLWFAGQPGMGAAIAGFLSYHAVMMAIDINNGNLLVFGLPTARRKELRTFIEGICLPVAAAAAGLFLIVVAPDMNVRGVALIGLAGAGLTFACNLIVRHDYVGAIAANLRSGWLDLSAMTPRRRTDSTDEHSSSPTREAEALALATGDARVALMTNRAMLAGARAIEPLLLAAGTYTGSERRLAEHLIVAMGAAAIPDLIEASESPRFSVRGRSIAMRALGKLDFARLRAIAGPLMLRTAGRAYEFLGRYHALELSGADDAGVAVLRRINRDYPAFTLEVVLEALTIAGQLPPYEAISAALAGGPSRDRGYAVEMIEQGAGRQLASLLTPWVSGWAPDRQLAHARAHGLLADIDEREALARALASAFPLEAAAAGQAFWERGETHLLLGKLNDLLHPILAETVRVLSARQDGGEAGLTPVECVAAVMRVPSLAIFRFVHLEWLARLLPTTRIPAGTCLARTGGLLEEAWVVLEGEILVGTGAETRSLGPGSIAGERALTGERRSTLHIAAGEGLRVVTLSTRDILACGEAFPELGIELLRWRMASL